MGTWNRPHCIQCSDPGAPSDVRSMCGVWVRRECPGDTCLGPHPPGWPAEDDAPGGSLPWGSFREAGGHAPWHPASAIGKGRSDEPDEHTENGVAPTGPVQLPELGQSLT